MVSGGWAFWTLLWYMAWLALVAIFAVWFGRSGERPGLVTPLVLWCAIAVPCGTAVAQAVKSLLGR